MSRNKSESGDLSSSGRAIRKVTPGPLAHHTSVVFRDYMYLFGGTNCSKENRYFFRLNLENFRWEVIEEFGKNHKVQPRDGHSACLSEEHHSMIVFGGFVAGERCNQFIIYSFKRSNWQVITYQEGQKVPCPRNGHSACIYGNFMYIFGGRANDNVKLNDTWKINLSSLDWEKVYYENEAPIERMGHSCDIIGKYMFIYGGINEITKEQNDMHALDLETNKWF